MHFIDKIKNYISNNSLKRNLLSLYSVIIIIMSFLLATLIFYSIDLNRSYNKILSNFSNYNKIYSQINIIDKDIYANIAEQKKFDQRYYDNLINDIRGELNEISANLEESKNVDLIGTIEILKRTLYTIQNYTQETGSLIQNNATFAAREEALNEIIHVKNMIKDSLQSLMELNLTQSQEHIRTIRYSYNIALTLIIIMFLVAIISSICFLLLVSRDTVEKINIVSENANKLAKGDLSIASINFSDSHEFQILALSFNKMKNNIKDYIDQLSSSEMRISSILNAISDCIITTNSSGIIESCNNMTLKIFGYSQDNIMGLNINELINAINFTNYNEDMFNSQKLINNVEPIGNKYEIDGLKNDGTKIPIEVSYNEIEVEGQRVMTFVINDITQRKEVEKMKDEFISIVSHELRTPLTSIKGALGLIASKVLGEIPQKAEDLLKIANNNCTRLAVLINDILDLEKIKARKMDFNFKEYDIVSIVQESLESSTEYAKQYNIEYGIVNPVDNAIVNVDKNRLIQVLFNLLSNAAKFSNPGSSIDIGIRKINDGIIRINVKDTGIGIPEDFKSKIYESFSQADSSDSRRKGGTGLGLSITKELVNIMGGTINFESKLNEGTNFYIDLPVKHFILH
jgi:PAS domain S-box-containing protein